MQKKKERLGTELYLDFIKLSVQDVISTCLLFVMDILQPIYFVFQKLSMKMVCLLTVCLDPCWVFSLNRKYALYSKNNVFIFDGNFEQ